MEDYKAGEIPEGFVMKPLDIAQQEEELGKVMEESFEGSVAGRILEQPTAETTITIVKTILHSFGKGDRSQVIVEEESGKIVAICVAGKDEKYPLHYTEIAELCVLPAYRERGLASFMIRSIATNAALEASPFVKAVLFEGDDIELLFRENGFFCGPAFVHMEKTE